MLKKESLMLKKNYMFAGSRSFYTC